MTEYDGPERMEPSEDSVVEVTEESLRGHFTVYLEPGETAEIRSDDPNSVTIAVPDREGNWSDR